jgi:hypothetical protein
MNWFTASIREHGEEYTVAVATHLMRTTEVLRAVEGQLPEATNIIVRKCSSRPFCAGVLLV